MTRSKVALTTIAALCAVLIGSSWIEARVRRDPNQEPSVPVGGVILWWGSENDLPRGFEVCDGTTPHTRDATLDIRKPDLRDRFAKGAKNPFSYRPQNALSGGANVVPPATEPHALVAAEMPAHEHSTKGHIHSLEDHGHSLDVPSHSHDLGSHDHSLNLRDHDHALTGHSHSINAHDHSIGGEFQDVLVWKSSDPDAIAVKLLVQTTNNNKKEKTSSENLITDTKSDTMATRRLTVESKDLGDAKKTTLAVKPTSGANTRNSSETVQRSGDNGPHSHPVPGDRQPAYLEMLYIIRVL